MRINHNIASMNTNRMLSINTLAGNKNLEKLSSGLRINKAGDDAAGLAISEKMRAQIRGLNQASANAQDGISLIQTAEGALNETHSILQRMRELAGQAVNGTNTDADRASIQTEISQLKEEIDRIGNTTEFNTKKLIDGSIGSMQAPGVDNAAVLSDALGVATSSKLTGTVDFNAGANKIANTTTAIDTAVQTINIDGNAINFSVTQAELQATAGDTTGTAFATLLQTKINESIYQYNEKYGQNVADVAVSASANKISITSGTTGTPSSISLTTSASAANNLWEIAGNGVVATTLSGTGQLDGAFSVAGAANVGALIGSAVAGSTKMTFTVDGKDISIDFNTINAGAGAVKGFVAPASGADMTGFATALQTDLNKAIQDYNATVPTSEQVSSLSVTVKDGSYVIQSGSTEATSSVKFDTSTAAKLLGVDAKDSMVQGGGIDFQIGANQTQTMKVTVGDMRVEALGLSSVDMSTSAGAQTAIGAIDKAIETVSSQRSNLGAFQNRLEHTISNLGAASENLSSAESRIRDVDMAKEMTEFTKNNILSQAAQAMLAQANQQPQAVLQLLR